MPRSFLQRETPSGMPMANATAIAVRAASPEEIRHATRMPAARRALTPGALLQETLPKFARRETLLATSLLQHWSHRLQDFSPPYDLWSNQANHSLLLPRCISLSIGFSVCYGHQNLCYFTLSLYKIVHFADLLGKNMTSDLR
jgi:hypothetical protein